MKVGTFYGKEINKKMTKEELLDVIIFLVEDNKRLIKREITPEEEVNRLLK